jgi:hypothetical protein
MPTDGCQFILTDPVNSMDSNKAARLPEDYRNAIHDLIAQESFMLSCEYALTKKQRQRLLPDARALWDAIMLDAPAFIPILSLVVSSDRRAQEEREVTRCAGQRQR